MLENITKWTNSRLILKNIDRRVTVQELKKYIAVLLFNGVLGHESWEDLWQNNGIVSFTFFCFETMNCTTNYSIHTNKELGQEFAKKAFANKKDFFFIQTNICFYEHPFQDNGSKTAKVDNLVTYLNYKFVYYYDVGKYIVIDEGIIPYKGSNFFTFFFLNFPTY